MAIQIVSASRINPSPCQHYAVVVDVDGAQRTVRTSISQLQEAIEDASLEDLILSWAKYKLSKGAQLADLVGATVVE